MLTVSVYVPRPLFVLKFALPPVPVFAVWFCVVPLGVVHVAATVAPEMAVPFASFTITIPVTLT